MRKWSIVLTLAVVFGLMLGAAGCGGASNAALVSDDAAPEEILAAAYAASYDLAGATGGFDFELTIDADLSQVPADAMEFAQPMIENGVSLSGTFAYAGDPGVVSSLVAEYAFSGQIMGQPLDMGVKLAEDNCWLSYAGMWYEMPAEAMQMAGDYTTQVDTVAAEQLLADLGLDPVTWLKDLRVVGEETLGGAATVHLAGSPDLMKMMTDGFELMRSEEFREMIDPAGSFTGDMMGSGFPPSATEIEEMRPFLEAMLSGTTVDLWVGRADAMLRKIAVFGHIAPPPGEDPEGFVGLDFSTSMWLDAINPPVTVEPPASPLPFMELMDAIEADPGIFQMFGDMSYGAGYDDAEIRY